jgi:putative MATE family efflux protein
MIVLKNKNVNMLSGSITKGLLAMTMPIMIMNVMQNLFSIIDMTILGQFAGDDAVGSVGACSMLITLCTCLLIGIATGANIVVAKRMGSQDSQRTKKAADTAMILAIIGGLLLLLIGTVFAETFLRWVNCPERLLDKAVVYFRIYFYGAPFLMLYNFSAAILRAIGDTKRPMYFLLFSGGMKVILSIVFIKFLNLDVEGVGIATLISNILASSLCIFALRRSTLQFRFRKMQFSMQEMRDTLHLGIPTGLQQAFYAFANVIIATAVNSFGPEATTGISIANQIDGVMYYVACAPSLATAPYVAQNVGAHNFPRVKKVVVSSIVITIAFGGILGALFSIFAEELASIMTSSPAVIAYATQKTVLICATYFLCGINEVMSGVLRGLGKPIIPTISVLLFMCLIRFVWVYVIFPLVPNLTFLYLIWPIGWVLSITTLLIAYFPTIRRAQARHSTP